ncbi:Uncharacterised protein [Candidatus Norongarragalina meridionalis]|nr:Uncharacterised protein [Candidatus Norongarragalina meridionalis]
MKGTGKKETVYYFLLSAFTKALTYFLLLAFANLFSPIDYGKATFATMVYTVASAFIFPGLTTVFVPAYVRKHDVASLFFFSGACAFAFAALTLLVSTRYALVWPLALCFVFAWITGIARAIMRAEHKYHHMQFTEILFVLSNLFFVFYWRGLGDVGIIYALAVATFVSAVASMWISRDGLARIIVAPRLDMKIVRTFWVKGLSVAVLLLSFDVLGRGDAVIMGFLSTFENVARYNIASAIAGALTIISMSISMFLLTRSAELGEEGSGGVFLRSVRIAFSLNLAAAIALVSFIHPIIATFFSKYAGDEIYVAILAASTLFYSIYLLYVTQLAAHLAPERALKTVILAAAVNVLLDFLLIPQWGMFGICAATLVSGALAFSLIPVGLSAAQKAAVYVSPALIGAAFLLGPFGLLMLVPALALLAWSGMFRNDDWLVLRHMGKEILRF